MLYQLFKPTPELADVVSCYWYAPIQVNRYSAQQFDTPLFESLVFNFSKLKERYQYAAETTYISKTAYFFGQCTSPTVISGRHEKEGFIIGVSFKPLGIAKLTGISMHHFSGMPVDAMDVWGKESEMLYDAMQEANSTKRSIVVLESFLKKQLRSTILHYRSEQVMGAISLMKVHNGNISCADLHYHTNTSKKTLERAFVNFHGVKPKMYSQLIRYNSAKQLMALQPKQNLTRLSHSLGYFDQSHFIKDFKRFSGETPTGYLQKLEETRKKRTIPVD